MNENQENLPPHVVRKVCSEFKSLMKEPIDGIEVQIDEKNISQMIANIQGPQGTPFAGGVFKIKIVLTKEFPQQPPKGFFLTKIFHPNVGPSGEICVNTLKQDWNSKMGIKNVLLTIRCLLIHPNPQSALNEEAGRMLQEDYSRYSTRARLMTDIHATPSPLQQGAPSTSAMGDSNSKSQGPSTSKQAKITSSIHKTEKKKKDKKRNLKRL